MRDAKTLLAALALSLLFLPASAQECEKIQNMAIMYGHYACRTGTGRLNFWASDLSLLENNEQPEFSASCQKNMSANRPQSCGSRARSPDDHAVLVFKFVGRKHFCNFTLPARKKDNLLRLPGYSLADADSMGLRMIEVAGPRAFDQYFADLAPRGEVLVRCRVKGTSCDLEAVTEDGQYLLEINFVRSELANWRTLLAKTRTVASKCL
jgi:hypothetical protein